MIFKQMYATTGDFILNINSSVADPDLYNLAITEGWNQSARVIVNITAPYVNRLRLLNTWSFPGGLEIEIANGSLVGGLRGLGRTDSGPERNGSPGGEAILVQIPVSIRNFGTIAGGGGGGGAGMRTFITYTGNTVTAGGGSGGNGQGFTDTSSTTPSAATAKTNGGYVEYGGPIFGGDVRPWAQGGNGGSAGGWGAAGNSGTAGTVGGSYDSAGNVYFYGNGGSAGNSVVGNSFVTWLATGTRLGPIV